ncbi:MAG: MerR family transcriptional regulator [Chloroflexi bacterium]|nr:MerR family transcriptional regulator [Chloroflexota bacterium]
MEDIRGVYVISVAARLLSVHPQTLRKYERVGLIQPLRSSGMLRLYSEEDVARLRLIKHLVEDMGLNLAGVELALSFAAKLFKMEKRLTSSDDEATLRQAMLRDVREMLSALGVA